MKKAYLKALNRKFGVRKYLVSESMTIGRSPDNHIHLVDQLVSRYHAQLQLQGKSFIIQDLNSVNGTIVNGKRVNKARLFHQDRVCIGECVFSFEIVNVEEQDDSKSTTTLVSLHKEREEDNNSISKSIDACYSTATSFDLPLTSDVQNKHLNILMQACTEMPGERDIEKLFNKILSYAFELIPAHRGVIMLKEQWMEKLTPRCFRTRDNIINPGKIEISSTIVNKVVSERVGIIIKDTLTDDHFKFGQSIILHDIRSAMCVPMIYQDNVLGIIYVDSTRKVEPFSREELTMLNAIAGPAATAISNAHYVQKVEDYARTIEKSRDQTLTVVANTLEGRDHYTVGHAWRVTNFALALAEELGWSQEGLEKVHIGGLLHDIGKIAVNDAILRKDERLTEEEYEKMKIHPEKGAKMLKDCEALEAAIPFALYHHERYDGSGYPFGKSNEEIPVEGRLLAVADTFDALTSNRPYHMGLDPETAVAEIRKYSGTQFDPKFSKAFIQAYRHGKISSILQNYYKNVQSLCCPFCSTFIKVDDTCKEGKVIVCTVCHHRLKIFRDGPLWKAELL